jgi:hypothetical protein
MRKAHGHENSDRGSLFFLDGKTPICDARRIKSERLAPMGKTVLPSKFQEWKGLDRISLIVHDMKCIFREITKDDFGLDGEIEVVAPKADGKGWVKGHASHEDNNRCDQLALRAAKLQVCSRTSEAVPRREEA